MAPQFVAHLVPTHVRLDTDCPVCGWADLFHITVHSLTSSGVSIVAEMIRCARCENTR
ncbi:hypothetical protein [Microbacterium testaceum]|uniref:hypothetical protein n=1 Tax=Microbacterium testaceum TaxID=2033 RepID=UPI0024351E4F|nr:hypothetical protein [Microbacterium testaceum]